ncbi:MAG: glycosyltransferase family 4 protein [Planctomycetes bacterium]|nr:glycosyltransferase family 4 protein [Planctomycetota bacterium]
MHIALIREWFDRLHGGAERYAVNLAYALRERGHRVSVICDRWTPDDARGFEMIRVPFSRWLGPFAYERWAAATAQAAQRLMPDVTLALARSLGGDVCRVGDLLQRAWVEAHWPARKRASKLRWAWRIRRRMALEDRVFAQPWRRVIVESTLMSGWMREYFSLPDDRIALVPNGVDGGRFAPPSADQAAAAKVKLGLPCDAQVALFVSMDFRRKGLVAAARGFCEAVKAALPGRRKLMFFVAVGRGDGGIIERISRENALGAQLRVDARTAAIEGYYRAADVLVHPSKVDPGANVVLEALSSGVPAIVSANTGYRDAVENGRNGYVLARRDDEGEIGARIADVFAGRASQFAPSAVRAMSRLLTPQEHCDRIMEIISEAAEAKACRVAVRKD